MTDDLVKRLRDTNGGWASDEALEAADRIEALEADRDKLRAEFRKAKVNHNTWVAMAKAVETERDNFKTRFMDMRAERDALAEKLAKAVEDLERIGSGEFSGQMLTSMPPQDAAAYFARTTLAELEGETDALARPFSEYGNYGENNPPLGDTGDY